MVSCLFRVASLDSDRPGFGNWYNSVVINDQALKLKDCYDCG